MLSLVVWLGVGTGTGWKSGYRAEKEVALDDKQGGFLGRDVALAHKETEIFRQVAALGQQASTCRKKESVLGRK
jgi:hypothetical protein